MIQISKKNARKRRVRARIFGTAKRPRLSVRKTNRGMFLQVIDDSLGKTLAQASHLSIDKKMAKKDQTAKIGETLLSVLKKKEIKRLSFDRGSSKYHGRVKMIAEVLREGGIEV